MNESQDIQTALGALESSLARQGNAELQQRLQHYRSAFAQGHIGPDNYVQLGQLAVQVQQPSLAGVFYEHGLQASPASAELYFHYANLLHQQGRDEEASDHYKEALKYQPDLVDAYLNVAAILREQQRISEMIAWAEQAILKCSHVRGVGAAALRVTLGEAVKIAGDSERAIVLFREALALAPGHAYIYQGLAHTRKFTEHDEDIRQMETLYYDAQRSCEDRSRLGFALGKAYEDLAEYEQSFRYYQQANALNRSLFKYETRDMRTHFNALKESFSRGLFEEFQASGSASREPVFIVGMPRSGTTLVEKILASHPLVYGAGELTLIPRALTYLTEDSSFAGMIYPADIKKLDRALLKKAAEQYLLGVKRLAPGDWQRSVDKLPHNFVHVGLIRLLFPNAKIIHCKRHPMDTCLSLYKHLFSGPHPYCYDMVELGQYYCLYQELMAHWHAVLPGHIYDIEYETLVENPRQEIESLLGFCELPWDDACLEHDKSASRSVTASSVQVNRPIYKDSLDYWRNYELFLRPLADALEFYRPVYDYEGM